MCFILIRAFIFSVVTISSNWIPYFGAFSSFSSFVAFSKFPTPYPFKIGLFQPPHGESRASRPHDFPPGLLIKARPPPEASVVLALDEDEKLVFWVLVFLSLVALGKETRGVWAKMSLSCVQAARSTEPSHNLESSNSKE